MSSKLLVVICDHRRITVRGFRRETRSSCNRASEFIESANEGPSAGRRPLLDPTALVLAFDLSLCDSFPACTS